MNTMLKVINSLDSTNCVLTAVIFMITAKLRLSQELTSGDIKGTKCSSTVVDR